MSTLEAKVKDVYRSLMHHCLVSGRIGDTFYHISCLAAICILLLRVKVILPPHRQALFNAIHALILAARFTVGVLDVIYSRIWSDISIGVCRYKDKHEVNVHSTTFIWSVTHPFSRLVSLIRYLIPQLISMLA